MGSGADTEGGAVSFLQYQLILMDEDAFELQHDLFEVSAIGCGQHQLGRALPWCSLCFIAIEIEGAGRTGQYLLAERILKAAAQGERDRE